MSKTPFEIRLELLKLANEILTQPVYQQREAQLQEWQASRECYPHETAPRNPQPFPRLPDFPTTAEVVAKAAELRAFVDQQ